MDEVHLTRHRSIVRALWALWLIGVVWGSLISETRMESLDRVVPLLEINDKVVHYGAYAGLGFLSMLAFDRRRGIAVAISMIVLGILLEIAQRLAPGRTPDALDALANTLGILTGITLGSFLNHRRSTIGLTNSAGT